MNFLWIYLKVPYWYDFLGVIIVRTTKKTLSIVLAGLMTVGGMSVFSVSAAQTSTPTLSFKTQNALYAHAVSGSDDSDAWEYTSYKSHAHSE